MNENDMVQESQPVKTGPRFLRSLRTGERSGQSIVEFAVVSVAFFMLVFGTIDFGRAVYMYSELSNAVREGARYGKINPAETADIKAMVIDKSPSLNVASDDITVNCTGGCYPGCADVTVAASIEFKAITQEFLGIGPITLRSSAKVEAE